MTLTSPQFFPYGTAAVAWTGGGNADWSHDGRLLIQEDPANPVTITGYAPSWDASTRQNGAMLGLPGWMEQGQCGMDGRMSNFGNPANLLRTDVPCVVPVNQVFCISTSHEPFTAHYVPSDYPTTNTSRSVIDYMSFVCVVPYDPVSQSGNYFAPPLLGMNALANWSRSEPIIRTRMTGAFPDVVDLSAIMTALGGTYPDDIDDLYDNLNLFFARPSGDIFSGWATDGATPSNQHPGYGTWLAAKVSEAMVLLCALDSQIDGSAKIVLATKLCQWGLDLMPGFLDGRQNYSDGGHCAGRKGLICFAGYALKIHELLHCSDLFANAAPATPWAKAPFREDGAYFFLPNGAWFNGGAAGTDIWTAGWRKNSTVNDPIVDGTLWNTTPTHATWGASYKFPGCWASQVAAYMGASVRADIGQALFWNLVQDMYPTSDIIRGWSQAGVEMVRQWMGTQDAQMLTDLQAVGFDTTTTGPPDQRDLPFGLDYTGDPGIVGLCATAWTNHAV